MGADQSSRGLAPNCRAPCGGSFYSSGVKDMAWKLRKNPTGIKQISPIKPIKPIKPIQLIKPVQPVRPIKPIAPFGYEYYWVPAKK